MAGDPIITELSIYGEERMESGGISADCMSSLRKGE